MTTRYDKLFAVFEAFTTALQDLDDPFATNYRHAWETAKHRYEQAIGTGVTRSAIASGMEQGLREMPFLFAEISESSRARAVSAWNKAILTHYPEFVAKDAERMAAVLARGRIRNEREYYLVRYRIDELETGSGTQEELDALYRLVDAFES